MRVSDLDLVLPAFGDVWFTNCHSRYRGLKGARETGKTYNFVGLEPIFKILSDSRRNIMMIRQNDKDNGNSTFTQLKSICRKLNLLRLFKFTNSPRKITRIATGQVILFCGMNDVENITSTTVDSGYWTDIYFEEASQLKSFEDFRVVDGSLRLPADEEAKGLNCQITFCFNAWDVGHFLYTNFFKGNLEDNVEELEDKGFQFKEIPNFNIGYGFGLALHISSYKCNTHRRREKDLSVAILKEKAYDTYLVESLGCWGQLGDQTYSHFSDKLVIDEQMANNKASDCFVIGIDTGLSDGQGKIKYSESNAPRLGSAMTMQLIGVGDGWRTITALDEYFDSNIGRQPHEKKSEPMYVEELLAKMREWNSYYKLWNDTIFVYVDSADVGFRDTLEARKREYGLDNFFFIKSTKRPILDRVRFSNQMMAFSSMLFSTRCKNLVREIKNARKSKEGKVREDFDDHAINAWEYSWAVIVERIAMWGEFKSSE